MELPTDPAIWARILELATPEERAEIDALLQADLAKHIWRPQVGRQSQAADSIADITGYGGSAGGGKGLALDTPIPTPAGWSTMGALQVGDWVFDEAGSPCKVIAASPINHRDCYRLTFDDGCSLVADDVHRWVTFDAKELSLLTRRDPEWKARRRAKRPSRAKGNKSPAFVAALAAANAKRAAGADLPDGTMRDTSAIAATLRTSRGRRNHAIRVTGALDLPAADLPIDPYVLGVWLGDGTTRAATVTTVDVAILEELNTAGHRTALACRSDIITFRVFDLQAKLRALGVLGNKHIPATYLRASMTQRLALLQGLMDTDGHCALDGGCQFDGTHKPLIDGVHELVLSLGIKPSLTEGRATLKGRYISAKWRVSFNTDMPAFRLQRKLERQSAVRRTTRFRYVTDCEPVASVPTRCIAVDSPTRMYLAGREMVPTHNTDLGCGLALTQHQRSGILRREKAQTQGIVQRLEEILGARDGYNSQDSQWRLTTPDGAKRLIEFGGLDNPGDYKRWQGRAQDFKYYDEVTEMREFDVRFTMGWVRTSQPGQRCRVLMGFNPPTTAEGRWVLQFFGPWLDKNHHRPAVSGELRWVTTIGGKDYWCEDERPFVMFKGEPLYDFDPGDFTPQKIITPKSRTFIPSRVTDNYFYVSSGYIQQLQALPEPLRSQMLDGDFSAGMEDDEWQVIPTAWIDAAMARWEPRPNGKGTMDSMGVDVACGGTDSFVIAPRHGFWFDQLIRIPGHEIPQETAGRVGSSKVILHRRDRAVVHVDLIGWGLTVHNSLVENNVQTIGVNVARSSVACSIDGKFDFFNLRSELVWRMREALDPENKDQIALPPDPALKADLCAYRWTIGKGKRRPVIKVLSKDDMKRLLGRSPDDGDAVIMANIETLKDEQVEALRPKKAYDPYADLR
jgi:LAGLIDADG-like domain